MNKKQFIEKLEKEAWRLFTAREKAKSREHEAMLFGYQKGLLYVIDQLKFKVGEWL